MEENLQTTAGEAGANTNVTIDAESVASAILNAIEAKNIRNAKSIENDNLKNLSEDDAAEVKAILEERRTAKIKEAEEEARKQKEYVDGLEKELASYKAKEKESKFNTSVIDVLNELDVTDDGSQKQALKLLTAGNGIDVYFDDKNDVNLEKFKEDLSVILADVPSLKSAKKDVDLKIGKKSADEEAIKKEQERIFAEYGI